MRECLWTDQGGQDIAEYEVMLAVVLVIVLTTVRMIGNSANTILRSRQCLAAINSKLRCFQVSRFRRSIERRALGFGARKDISL